MFNSEKKFGLKIEKNPEPKERGPGFDENKLNEISQEREKKKVESGVFDEIVRTAGIANEIDPRIEKSLKIIATFAENPENRKKIIDGLYGTPERKGWIEEEESTARLALNRILEFGIKLMPKSMLTMKEIELIAGIKGINSRKDIEKIKKIYPEIDVNKIAKNLKINRNQVYPIINILVYPPDRTKRILKMLYDTEEGKKIHISDIAKSLGITSDSIFPLSLEVLRYMGLVKLNKKKEIVINKEQFKEIYPGKDGIETWSVKKEATEEKKWERAKKGERVTQAVQVIAENIKKTGINMEEISDEKIKELVKGLSRTDFKTQGTDIPPNYIHHLKHTLLKKIERGELIPEIKEYVEEVEKIFLKASKL